MTIPTRPAPAPPGSRAQVAAAGANASLEQLRQQLQQQHQQQHQQQIGGMQNMAIKLPPPPKGPAASIGGQQTQRNFNNNYNNNNTSITRKFPQARYAPATNWDDDPFGATSTTTNGNFKKVPPPRPPPPKVQANGRKPLAPTPPVQSANILANIFHRKRAVKAPSRPSNGTRVYGVSSGNYNISSTTKATTRTTTTTATATTASTTSNTAVNWNADWSSSNGFAAPAYSASASTASSTYSYSSYTQGFNTMTPLPHLPTNVAAQELISFDSPPSSPTFTQKSNSDCVSVDSFSSDSNFSSPNNGSVSQPESGFEDDFSAARSRPSTTSPLDPWETNAYAFEGAFDSNSTSAIGTAPVRNLNVISSRTSVDNPLCNGKSLLPPPPSLAAPTIIKPKISQKPKAPRAPAMFAGSRMELQNAVASEAYGSNVYRKPTPQPPVTISLLDVISGKVDALSLGNTAGGGFAQEASQPYGVALYDFGGVEEGDLCFKENEKIYLLERVSEEWYRGRTRAGCEGIFPANYVDIKVPLDEASSAETTPTYQQQNGGFAMPSQPTPAPAKPPRVRCLYNFEAEETGDLLLKENDMVTILYRINEDWLFGEIAGRQGQFPANFLEYIPADLPIS